ncbi:hypothetical protein EYF80_006391 [Liparis tanakae]|uniref:Secreted protein n=1 Tax=Liparis tanakae TaxID=230148 RepID=A0A4Z2IZI9_9TELE|nr:hypothetical protein EYF80_006391 [Liparis tanakae]
MFFLSWLTARASGTASVCLITLTDSPTGDTPGSGEGLRSGRGHPQHATAAWPPDTDRVVNLTGNFHHIARNDLPGLDPLHALPVRPGIQLHFPAFAQLHPTEGGRC